MTRVLDIGAGNDPDGRATETVDLYADADHQFDLGAEWPLAADSVDGVVANHVVEHLDAEHVFRQAGRVLRGGGWFELTVPLGENAKTDPDHVHQWTYGTPSRFCQQRGQHWDVTVPFELQDVTVDGWLGGPLEPLSKPFGWLAAVWPAWVSERCYAGELTARYRRVSR